MAITVCMYVYSSGNAVIGDVDMNKDIGGFITVLHYVLCKH